MRISIVFFVALLFSQSVFSQNINRDKNAVEREVADFDKIEASLGIKVYLSSGNENSVYVSADDADHIQHIKTEVKDNTLRISFASLNMKISKNISGLKAYVTVKDIEKIVVGTGAEVLLEDNMNFGELVVEGNTGGSINGKLEQVNKLTVNLSTGSKMEISGKVGELNIDCSLGSKFQAYDLEADKCIARAHTSGKIEINVQDLLTAVATTGGNISYKGNASVQEVQIKTGGTVVSKN